MRERSDSTAAFRVAVWGPGGIGKCLVRESLRKPELELVGALCYSPDKNGEDVGEYFGFRHAGVRMTQDKEEIFRLKPDVVLYCPKVSAGTEIDSEVTNDLCRMLESGINVVTSVAYHYLPFQGEAFVEKIEAACRKGATALHSTGINPGILNERWVVGLTGVCTEVKSIKAQEISNISTLPSLDMLVNGIGIGKKPTDELLIEKLGDRYYSETIHHTCALLGHTVEKIETEKEYILSKEPRSFDLLSIEKDTISGIVHRFIGHVGGRPFFILEQIFFMDEKDCPVDVEGAPYLATAAIEAEPTSVYSKIFLKASVLENRALREDGTRPTYNATAAILIQAIPIVCGARPGVVYPFTFAHYVPDLRQFKSPLIVQV